MTTARGEARRIAFYCVATHLGGAERSLLDLLTRLSAASDGWYRPFCVLPQREGPLVDRLVDADVPFDVLPMPEPILGLSRSRPLRSLLQGALALPALRRYLRDLEGMVREAGAALVHTTGLKCHLLSGRLSPGLPVLWHLRDILGPGPARSLLRRVGRRHGVHVLANSHATARDFDPEVENPRVVYNGIDTSRFRPGDDPVFRARFPDVQRPPVVGIVGVIQRGKGIADFLGMAALLVERGSTARFVVVGDEIYDTGRDRGLRQELEAQAATLGLNDRVAFVGYQEDAVQVMHGLDLLVSASVHPESFGRVLVEAMACGVPVVASAIGATLELVEDGVTGRLFAAGDAAAMARAVSQVLDDEELRRRLIECGRRRVEDRFGIDSYVSGVIRAYDSVLWEHRSRRPT